MADLSAIRQALADKMGNVYGLRSSATMPDAPRPPQAVILPDRIEYDLDMSRGADMFFFLVTVIVGRADDRAAQNNLDRFVSGTDSIKAAIEADMTLGGVVNFARVTEMTNYRQINVGDTIYLGAEFEVEVVA